MLTDSFLDYLQYERNYSKETLRAYKEDLREFVDFVKEKKEGTFVPEAVDADIVRDWVVSLMDKGEKTTSVNRKLSSLKSFYKYLRKDGVVETNPLRFITGLKVKKSLPYFVQEKDMATILDSDDFDDKFEGVRDRLILEMLYETGMRRAELVALKDADIDFDTMQLRVTGKRNKQRIIPYGDRLKKMMKAYISLRDSEVECHDLWFFVQQNGEQITDSLVYKVVHQELKKIPTLSKCSPHVLRHSFATSMLNNGAELNSVKELLGHSSLASTAIYTHTTFEELKRMYHAHPRAQKEGG